MTVGVPRDFSEAILTGKEDLQDKMHLCPAAALLYCSLRNEQTVVLGLKMTLGKVLSTWQVHSTCP
jgi:hypothetical protein